MPGVDGSGITNTEYPAVRRVMGPQRDRLDDAELEDLIVERFPGADPLDVEDFMHDLERLGKQVAPLANRALPGALQGAAQGATVAGPYGALAGAAAGIAGGLLGGRIPAAPPRPGGAAPPPPGPPSAAPPPPPPPAAVPGAAPYGVTAPAAQLLALLSRPETMQALLALTMSDAGRRSLRVGGTTVAPAAFAKAISRLADEAAAESALPSAAEPQLLTGLAVLAEEEDSASDEAADLEAAGEGDPLDGYAAALEGWVADGD